MTGTDDGGLPIVASGAGSQRRPAVSVVLPVSGPSPGLKTTLLDLQRSTGVEMEVVLVSAGEVRIPDEVAASDARVRTVRAPLGTHETELQNLGVLAARGASICFLDPGDRVGPRVLTGTSERLVDGVVVAAAFAAGERPTLLDGAGLVLADARHARSGRFEERLGARATLAFWIGVVSRHQLQLAVVDAEGARPTPPPVAGREWTAGLAHDLELLAALERPLGDPATPRPSRVLVDETRSWVGRQLNAVIAVDPARHATVAGEVRRRSLAHFPWPEVNAGLARHLAVLHVFPPTLDTSALVAARRVRVRGEITDVVSQDVGWSRGTDPKAVDIAAEFVDESRVLERRTLPLWSDARAFTEEVLANVRELEEHKGPYLSLYSRAMWAHSHVAAAVLKLRSPDLFWVAEFSDPLRVNPQGELRLGDVGQDWLTEELGAVLQEHGYDARNQRSFYEWAELLPYALADEILYTNEHQRSLMLGYCASPALADRARARSRVEHHPLPGPDLYDRVRSTYPLKPGRVHIGYFGSFYVTRGLGEVIDALALLEPGDRARVQLHIFTANPEPLLAEMIERGVADVVRVAAMTGFLEYLNATTRFDVLLLGDYRTKPQFDINPYLPAKLADYLGSGSRIWGVVEPGSVLSTFELAYRSELGDAAGASSVLRRIIADTT